MRFANLFQMKKSLIKIISANNVLLVVFLVGAAMACTPTANTNVVINADGANINSNAAVNLSSDAVSGTNAASPAAAPTTAPDALVADLYKQHEAEKSPFFQTKNRALVDKYFVKSLAAMIWKDAVSSKGEVGALEADPLYNAQDTEIKNFKVGSADIEDKSATVPVTFDNFKEKENFIFSLVQENGNWKIADINYGDGLTLVKIFKDNAAAYSGDDNKDAASIGEFEGKYQIGDTTCTVKPIKMAFEVKWEKGSGSEIFFFKDHDYDKYTFASDPKTGKPNIFSFDDKNYNTGTFYRADGKEFPIKRAS